MNYLSKLNDDEIHFICSAISTDEVVEYFKNNPKEFAKIRPGFRSTEAAISKLDVSNLLYTNINRRFIAVFINERLEFWLQTVDEYYRVCLNNGDNVEAAHIKTLPYTCFARNVSVYFKLKKESHSEEYIRLLDSAVSKIREANDQNERHIKKIEYKDAHLAELQKKARVAETSINQSKKRITIERNENKALKRKNHELTKLDSVLKGQAREIEELSSTNKGLRLSIQELKGELSKLSKTHHTLLSKQEHEKATMQKAFMYEKDQEFYTITHPKCPRDMDEFEEYIGYNLDSIGISNKEAHYGLIIAHLSKILFKGLPIVINRNVGLAILKSVANTLVGRPSAAILKYEENISIEEIDKFLQSAGRIACLDNFLGNFNETELISLFDKHRERIIFLTLPYDRTLKYVSYEFMRYSNYLNLNRVGIDSYGPPTQEDPSTLDEIDCAIEMVQPENRFARMAKAMLKELDYPKGLIEQKCSTVSCESDLSRILAFDVLPYCTDVLQIKPFNCSEKLNKYAGESSKYKSAALLRRWFS